MPSLSSLIRSVLALDPSAPAIEFERRWHSWGEVRTVIDAIDAALDGAELGRGTRVAVMLRNHPLTAAALLGVPTADRCLVTLNPSLPVQRLAADITTLRPPVVIGLARDLEQVEVRDAMHAIGCLALVLDGAGGQQALPRLESPKGMDLMRDAPGIAIEMLTSGTTGTPKRIPLTATAFDRAIVAAGIYDGRQPDDPARLRSGVQIINAPFAHLSGVFGLFNCVASGRAICLLERFRVDAFLDALRRHRPKVASAPPSAVRMILDAAPDASDFSGLVAFRAGTAPLDPALADEFYERYGVPVLTNYGATEFAGGVAGWTLADFKVHYQNKRGSVGRMHQGIAARIVDPDTGNPVALGEEGLLELKGSQLGNGGGWLRTTDLGVLDVDDFLWINGRYDNAIIRGGFKIIPDDVVRALETHPAIREAAVIGLPDRRLGAIPVAAYIVRAGASAPTDDELAEFLRERLLAYQMPARALAIDEFPRTPSMKISQPDLRALLSQTLTPSDQTGHRL